MRIRLWNAFASNNSGSYTIVGSFRSAERAAATAELIRPLLAEHSAWLERPKLWGEAPLHRFIRERGLTPEQDKHAADWPQYGPPPEVVAISHQVLVHAEYTVTMPRMLGELFYAEGGRVNVELDHAHHPTVVVFEIWLPWELCQAQPEQAQVLLAQLLATLQAGPLTTHVAPGIPPAWGPGQLGDALQIGVVFEHLVEGVRAVQAIVATTPAHANLRVFEAPHESDDPLAFLRGERATIPGDYLVILWRAGPERATTLEAIRAVIGGGLREAVQLLDTLPVEILTGINRQDAQAAVELLTQAGADAELVSPNDQRSR